MRLFLVLLATGPLFAAQNIMISTASIVADAPLTTSVTAIQSEGTPVGFFNGIWWYEHSYHIAAKNNGHFHNDELLVQELRPELTATNFLTYTVYPSLIPQHEIDLGQSTNSISATVDGNQVTADFVIFIQGTPFDASALPFLVTGTSTINVVAAQAYIHNLQLVNISSTAMFTITEASANVRVTPEQIQIDAGETRTLSVTVTAHKNGFAPITITAHGYDYHYRLNWTVK